MTIYAAGWKHVFYGIMPNGDIHWHQLVGGGDGSPRWTVGSGTKIGSGFGVYNRVFSPCGSGILYAVKPNGDLHIYIHQNTESPTSQWDPMSGRKLSYGWDALRRILAVSAVFYADKPNGDVLWYLVYNWASSPPMAAALDIGRKVFTGWQRFDAVFGDLVSSGAGSGGPAVFYGREPNGDLYWNRHDDWFEGTPALGGGGWRKVGDGWNIYCRLMTGSVVETYAIVYGLTHDGVLRWYRHDGALTGTPTWTAADGGRKVGEGFDRYAHLVCGDYRSYNPGGEGPIQSTPF